MARGPSGLPSSMGAAPTYLPKFMGGLGNEAGALQKGFPSPVGKSLRLQNLGNILGLRGAGISKAGGSQLAHSFNHYGKMGGDSGLVGGSEPSPSGTGEGGF